MDGRENSKVQQQLQPFEEQYNNNTSPYFSYPFSLSFFTPNEFNELNNARAEADTSNSNPNDVLEEHCCAKSDTDSCSEACFDASDDEEVSLDELLFDGKTMKKIELLAAIVGVDTTDPAIVLNEVVRVLKVLKRMHQY